MVDRKADALAPLTPVLLPVESEKDAIPATPTPVGKPLETVDEETELQPMAEDGGGDNDLSWIRHCKTMAHCKWG